MLLMDTDSQGKTIIPFNDIRQAQEFVNKRRSVGA
jgi:hypothetical protein